MFFVSSNAICVKKKLKKFLWFQWWGETYHQRLKLVDFEQWGGYNWAKYELTVQCLDCGGRMHRFGVDEVDILRVGIDPENPPIGSIVYDAGGIVQ